MAGEPSALFNRDVDGFALARINSRVERLNKDDQFESRRRGPRFEVETSNSNCTTEASEAGSEDSMGIDSMFEFVVLLLLPSSTRPDDLLSSPPHCVRSFQGPPVLADPGPIQNFNFCASQTWYIALTANRLRPSHSSGLSRGGKEEERKRRQALTLSTADCLLLARSIFIPLCCRPRARSYARSTMWQPSGQPPHAQSILALSTPCLIEKG
ncbi:hypothetical protein KCU88_g405, partial [Aureobasidium melanogenum]